MSVSRFIEIHTLHSYAAALLNRDDSGMAKQMPFGGAIRTRISSQCLKRHWRTADSEYSLHNIVGIEGAQRSRNLIRLVTQPLYEKVSEETLTAVEEAFNKGVYGEKGTVETGRQPLLLGNPEIEYLKSQAAAIIDTHGDDAEAAVEAVNGLFQSKGALGSNFQAFRNSARLPAGIEGALFGRMVTSDPKANIDASIHAAHSFTVHREESESDYFSVVDDLNVVEEDFGAAHIGEVELTSGLYYGYVVVDVPALVSNLEGCPAAEYAGADRTLAGDVVHNLCHLIAKVSPAAKLGSTAAYGRAKMMLVQCGDDQPYTLADAFRSPVQPTVAAAIEAMSREIHAQDSAYGVGGERMFMSVEDLPVSLNGHADAFGTRMALPDLAKWVRDTVVAA